LYIYSPNGKSHIEFLEKLRKEQIGLLFIFYKKRKQRIRRIIMVIDNLSSQSFPIFFTKKMLNFQIFDLYFNAPITLQGLNPAETPIKEI
jgi:hypothetical protein